jgi:hypothetical protein
MRNNTLVMAAIISAFTFVSPGNAHASSAVQSGPVTPPNTWKDFKVRHIVCLSANDFTAVTGKKLNLPQRIAFAIMKKKMKKAVRKNQDITVGEYLTTLKKLEMIWLIVVLVLALLLLVVILALLGALS